MLIYNYKKEFLGIDEDDLKALGLSSIAELQGEAEDFADLFVKKPGFIHNFKHIHWIDYIECNDDTDSKVILHIKENDFLANIDIKTIYLMDNPAQKAYIVNLNNIKSLSDAQNKKSFDYVVQKPLHREDIQSPKLYDIEKVSKNILTENQVDSNKTAKPDLNKESAHKQIVKIEQTDETKKNSSADYIYTPEIASEELGLPIDLIEEFIQDFIAQAESFKSELYEAAKTRNLNHLRMLSHKLKGVAANLRIENALSALSIINTSNDDTKIKTNLDKLYKIIYKLSGKEELETQHKGENSNADSDAEDKHEFVLSFKEDFKNEDASNIKNDDSKDQNKIDNEDLSIFDNYDHIFQEKIAQKSPDTVFAYDKKKIADDIGLNIESFNELFEDYLHETKKISNLLLESIQKGDLNGCRNAALKIKGMSENMRVHDFDKDLDVIINTDDINRADEAGKNITETLNKILNIENR